jgi:hypothetical protein
LENYFYFGYSEDQKIFAHQNLGELVNLNKLMKYLPKNDFFVLPEEADTEASKCNFKILG